MTVEKGRSDSGGSKKTADKNTVQASLKSRLKELKRRNLKRGLQTPSGLDFSSNDYLGLGGHPIIAGHVRRRLAEDVTVGAPASRLLRGHLSMHSRLEKKWADYKGTEASLLYPSGWQANVGLLTALVKKEDRVLSDALNHASLIDGLRLAGCKKVIYPHLDVAGLEQELARPWDGGHTYVLTESLYSMDGDVAPLDRYAELCERYGAELLVDDAHATGLWGERGSGLVEHFGVVDRVLAITSTGGKALGVSGGFVSGSKLLVDYLVNVSRSFIFSTAVSPLVVHGLEAALDVVRSEPQRRMRLHASANRLRSHLQAAGLETLNSEGPIVPVILGANQKALSAAEQLQAKGFDVRAIRPPTVAPGTARLRISVHGDHREDQIDALADALLEILGLQDPKSVESVLESPEIAASTTTSKPVSSKAVRSKTVTA